MSASADTLRPALPEREEIQQDIIPLAELAPSDQKGSAEVRVQVFLDANHNGHKNKYDAAFSGATVELVSCGENAQDDRLIGSVTTDKDGTVVFTDVPAGDCYLRCTLPEGYGFGSFEQTGQLNGSCMNRSSSRTQVSDSFPVVEGSLSQQGISVEEQNGIMGRIWLDENENGIYDEDQGIPGLTIEMEGVRNGLVYRTETDENGNYQFYQLRSGYYWLNLILPPGYVTTVAAGKGDRSVYGTPGVYLVSKQYNLNKNGIFLSEQNIGVCRSNRVTVTCFTDLDGNGIRSEDEEPYTGAELTLAARGRSVTQQIEENGQCEFTDQLPATYSVSAVLPKDGSVFTRTAEDGNAFTASAKRKGSTGAFELSGGSSVQLALGVCYPVSLSGRIERMDDPEDPETLKPARGIRVSLMSGEDEIRTVQTDRNGEYVFDNLAPGTYTIMPAAAEGYVFSEQADSSLQLSADQGAVFSQEIFAASGTALTGLDAVLVPVR